MAWQGEASKYGRPINLPSRCEARRCEALELSSHMSRFWIFLRFHIFGYVQSRTIEHMLEFSGGSYHAWLESKQESSYFVQHRIRSGGMDR